MTFIFGNDKMESSQGLSHFIHRWNFEKDISWMKVHFVNKWEGKLQACVWDSKGILRLQTGFVLANQINDYFLSQLPEESSLGAVPGTLQGGDWYVEIYAFGAGEVNYSFEVEYGMSKLSTLQNRTTMAKGWAVDCSETLALNCYPWQERIHKELKWYKGDLHTHTTISDGHLKPEELTNLAEARGLDFFAITDHNVLSTGWVQSNLLIIPGIEITSPLGHFNAIGIDRFIDWKPNCPDQGIMSPQGMIRSMQDGRKAGALCSVNHPILSPWDWQVNELPLKLINSLEIWNDPTYADNQIATEKALDVWSVLWNEGYRVVGVGGSDAHLRPDERYTGAAAPSIIGDPATCVLAEGLSAQDILDSLFKGRVYVTRGPDIILNALLQDQLFDPGSDLQELLASDKNVVFAVQYADVPKDSRLIWVANGRVLSSANVSGSGRREISMVLEPDAYFWIRAELRDSHENLLAVTNPISCGEKIPEIHTWGELLSKLNQ